MPQVQKISKNNTAIIREEHKIEVILHGTKVVFIDYANRQVTFDNGGWVTATTAARMNQTMNECGIVWGVSRKGGCMFAHNHITGEIISFRDNHKITVDF